MSHLVSSKTFAYLVVVCWSLWISLPENNHSSFVFVVSIAGEDLLPLTAMPMRAVNLRSKAMSVGHRTGTLRLRASMDDILF
jgi:hypothetical protein